MVADSLLLFKNYSTTTRPWISRRRSDAMTISDYTLDATTGIITLATPLSEGDSVIGAYKHRAGRKFASVRQLVLKAVRLELYTMFPHWSEAGDVIREAREAIENQIIMYGTGNEAKGIGEIDDAAFVQETREDKRSHSMRMPFMGGRG